jgi:hypothetical protein
MILFNENLPIDNKTKHQKRGRKRYKMEAFMSKQKEEMVNGCRLQWKHKQIKYSNPPSHKEHIRKCEEHSKKHLA